MPLRDDLLNPISGDNPSGANLRYEKVYDQIKEARTEDDESIPSGAWAAKIKKADFNLVIKLAGEALANKSKDLQLAAWLTEAHVKKEGIGLIQPCLKLLQDLQEQFWDTLYPEIEDGDVGMRAVPIEWAANRIASILREAPITRDGLNYYQFKESRAIGYEADAEYNEAKTAQRQQAIADGKPTAEDFDKSFNSTPKSWYVQMDAAFQSSMETMEALQVYCEEKYRDEGPGFGKLRTSLEEVGQVVSGLLDEKRKTEPDAPPPEEVVEEPEPEPEVAAEADAVAEAAPAAARPKAGKTQSLEPADREDAYTRVQACAKFLQQDNPASPVAYLLQAALRFGETREAGSYPAWDFLAPPPTEKRQNLKRLAAESNWSELLAEAIAAAGEPAGRGWLDVQRYIWRGSYESSYPAVSAAVIATLQALLKDVPEIPTWTLSDDTPTANPETQKWLEEMVIPKPPEPVVVEAQPEPEPVYTPPPQQAQENASPDVLDTARELMARGHLPQAIQLLMRDAAQQPSGRARFQRRLQIAQLCVGAGQGKVAYPVLEELVKEIDQRQLEEWEATDMIAPPLALLLKCLDGAENDALRETVFNRLCRIDPLAAMDVAR
ncbi:MAG TPA: type VI secretion system protein TssA [Terracidiphilus sp.]|nr:type VI secretion system protein TssA [Terracidiphilus sp.]